MKSLNFKSDGNDETIIQIPQIPKILTASLPNLIDENSEELESANLSKLIGGYVIVGSIIIGLTAFAGFSVYYLIFENPFIRFFGIF